MKILRMVVPVHVRASCRRLVFGLSLFFFLGAVSPAHADARPSLALSHDSYDFGVVAQGTVVVHEFEVKNAGTADLVIERIIPSCGCTAATMVSPTVKPGASERIKVTFDTSGFMGPKTKTVQILTNDPQSSEQVLKLKGSVLSGVKVEPSRVSFGEISPSAPVSDRRREFSVELVNGDNLEIAKTSTLSRFLTVTPLETKGRRVTVQVEVAPNTPRGDFRDRVVVELTGGRSTTINVPVTAFIAGDIRLSSSTVSFGVVSGGTVIERRVQFENRSSAPISLNALESSEPAVEASFVEVQPGRQGVIVLRLDPTKMKGDLRGIVQVSTTHPTEAALSINVTAVRPPR